MKNKKRMEATGMSGGIALGMGLGVALGVALDNIGLWLPVGAALGISLGAVFSANVSKEDTDDESDNNNS